jgi:hypothetical protein
MSPAEQKIRVALGAMAAAELATREQRYPEKIEQGKMSRESAEADIAAWRAIERLFATGVTETSLSWAELVHAARRQFDALARPTGGATPADPAKAERLGAVEAILSRLEWHRAQAMARPPALSEVEGSEGQGRVAA